MARILETAAGTASMKNVALFYLFMNLEGLDAETCNMFRARASDRSISPNA